MSHFWFVLRWLHILAMASHLHLWGDGTFQIKLYVKRIHSNTFAHGSRRRARTLAIIVRYD